MDLNDGLSEWGAPVRKELSSLQSENWVVEQKTEHKLNRNWAEKLPKSAKLELEFCFFEIPNNFLRTSSEQKLFSGPASL